jgi:predicted methyltransferase
VMDVATRNSKALYVAQAGQRSKGQDEDGGRMKLYRDWGFQRVGMGVQC